MKDARDVQSLVAVDSPMGASVVSPPLSPEVLPSQPQTATNGDERRNRGWFTPGNKAASKHDLYSKDLPSDVAALVEDAASFADRSMAEAGGRDNLSARARSLHQYRGIVHQHVQQVHLAISTKGLFDGRGKLRIGWLGKLESLMATARALDNLLGLERTPRSVNPQSPAEWLARQSQSSSPKE